MRRARLWRALGLALLLLGPAAPTRAEVSAAMRTELPAATYVGRLTPSARAAAARSALNLAASPRLSGLVSLTPDQPFAPDGSALNFWKPSFVLGTPAGGEAGVNFWGLHEQGHINVALAPGGRKLRLLDCRILSAGPVTYKIFAGAGTEPTVEGVAPLTEGHVLLAAPVTEGAVLVELWPTPVSEVMGFFGCDIAVMN